MINQSTIPILTLLIGPLADWVFAPAMAEDGQLAAFLGPWFGTGAGSGFAVMMGISGLGVVLVGITMYAVRVVRDIETILPDHDDQP
jgi:MFS transporter, DHA3 family, macrolide efflux protein